MARSLSLALDAVTLGTTRTPRYKVLVYDIRSTEKDASPTTINSIVRGESLPASVGPREFTADTISVDITEAVGDYIDSGIQASTLALRITDPEGEFDPIGGGSESGWLRQRNVVRIIEGDAQVPEVDWKLTFTGTFTGQPGLEEGRTSAERTLTLRAISRDAQFIKTETTSNAFPEGTLYRDMIEDILVNDMGLSSEEFEIPTIGNELTGIDPVQFVEQPSLISVAQIAFVDGFLPRFDGEGILRFTDSNINKSPARVYTEEDGLVRQISRPFVELNGINDMVMVGLDPTLEEVVGERQVLARAGVTLGYFTRRKRLGISFSEDDGFLAKDTRLVKRASINDGMIPLGSEEWNPQTDGPSGLVNGGTIAVNSPFQPAATLLTQGAMILDAAISDIAPPLGGPTIPVGKIAWASTLAAILTFMQTTGTGQYEITGLPVEFIYPEIRGTARVKGVRIEDRRTKRVENHLLQSQTLVNDAAVRALNLAQARQNVRSIDTLPDLLLEPNDVFEMPDERRYLIVDKRRTLRRGQRDVVESLSCFEVTPGVFP